MAGAVPAGRRVSFRGMSNGYGSHLILRVRHGTVRVRYGYGSARVRGYGTERGSIRTPSVRTQPPPQFPLGLRKNNPAVVRLANEPFFDEGAAQVDEVALALGPDARFARLLVPFLNGQAGSTGVGQ